MLKNQKHGVKIIWGWKNVKSAGISGLSKMISMFRLVFRNHLPPHTPGANQGFIEIDFLLKCNVILVLPDILGALTQTNRLSSGWYLNLWNQSWWNDSLRSSWLTLEAKYRNNKTQELMCSNFYLLQCFEAWLNNNKNISSSLASNAVQKQETIRNKESPNASMWILLDLYRLIFSSLKHHQVIILFRVCQGKSWVF